MPGVLILEAMVQAGDWLIQGGRRKPPGRFYLRALRAVKFVHFVQPGRNPGISVKTCRGEWRPSRIGLPSGGR